MRAIHGLFVQCPTWFGGTPEINVPFFIGYPGLRRASGHVSDALKNVLITTFFAPFRAVWTHFDTFKAFLTSETHVLASFSGTFAVFYGHFGIWGFILTNGSAQKTGH